MSANDVKIDLFNMINSISDIQTLIRMKVTLESEMRPNDEISIWKGTDTEIRKNVTFEDLMSEQNYAPISFNEFQEIVQRGKWETSLDELLEIA